MSITFHRQFVEDILKGDKTETRRLWKERTANTFMSYWRTGKIIKAKLNWRKIEFFAKLKVIEVRHEPACQMTSESCRREGFPELSAIEFMDEALIPINVHKIVDGDRMSLWVDGVARNGYNLYVVRFKVVGGPGP